VGAIYENPEVLGSHLLDLAGFDPLVPTPLDIQVFVAFAEGADAVATKAAVTEAVSDYGNAEVQDLEEFTESFFGQIDQLLNLIYALLGLAVIIAVIGIANTLALSVHERTHELGLLRAVGMTRSQLRGAIRWEAVIIALLGTALGIGVGIFFGWAMVQVLDEEGFTAFRLPWTTLAVVVVLAAVAGVVSALGPARRAARLEVMEAISTE
jgi:putative ABC transport system permease protein